YIVSELAACQAAGGDGYVGAATVERNGATVDGKAVYEEIRRGQIDAKPWALNGGWAPLYVVHKIHAGLLDAHSLCGDEQALAVARTYANYFVGVFSSISDEQMQSVLACEHGGVNESFAELSVRTGERRYLDLAQRFNHRAVLDPLMARRDELAGLHANTQIPKLVGLARQHEVLGEERYRQGAQFFFEAVTRRHSYVIGGNSEKEHFGPPDRIAAELTDRTCESCNTYNMLRLTRHLWSWRQDSAYFDYFERAHLNHIMAHQHPETGRKVYFMPLGIGTRRLYSRPERSFWCCVGTGMESHSKHGESIFWRRDDTLFVNLFVPASLNWEERGARFDLDTDYPNSERVDFSVIDAGHESRFAIAMRLPAWCASPALALNGRDVRFERRDGYAIVRRRWRDGDRLTLTLPMQAQLTAAPDDPRTFAFVSGPLVLAADLGEGNEPMAAPVPGLPMTPPTLQRIDQHVYRLEGHGGKVTMRPFFSQYDRWTAPYLQQIDDEAWAAREAAFREAQAQTAALDARTIDTIKLGEEASETAHGFRELSSDLFSAQGVYARQVGWGDGNYIAFDLAVQNAPMSLHVLYWGEDVDKHFDVSVAGTVVAHERLEMTPTRAFVTREYEIPAHLTRGTTNVPVQFTTHGSNALVYVVRTVRRA
ncbi:MAG: beta-L-arabinofuranosidase domain-containing protein, partial [Pseudomonadota bacterium]